MDAKLKYLDQVLEVTGDITFSTVQSLYDQLQFLQSSLCEDFCVQMKSVQRIDTASIAFCLSIERAAQGKVNVTYENVPSGMLAIAKSVGVSTIFE